MMIYDFLSQLIWETASEKLSSTSSHAGDRAGDMELKTQITDADLQLKMFLYKTAIPPPACLYRSNKTTGGGQWYPSAS